MKPKSNQRTGFTLIELLVVVSVISLLVSILVPALGAARGQARSALCKSNLRQLSIASLGYALENDDFFVPAAPDITSSNTHRWHGTRDNINEPFDPMRSPLIDYLQDGQVAECSETVKFIKEENWDDSFEKGCGGYGYNATYLGSRSWATNGTYRASARTTQVAAPAETVMFADTAMAKMNNGTPYLIEYSFAEPVFSLFNGQVDDSFYMSPSIHFRHNNRADVAWVDGHVDDQIMTQFDEENAYGIVSAELNIGWFGPLDNSLFDLE